MYENINFINFVFLFFYKTEYYKNFFQFNNYITS